MSRLRVYLLLCVPYSFLVARFRFTTDDAYISFRYARNLALGHGLRFNLAESPPVEGYSNFLWVLLGALFEKAGLALPVAMIVVSAACGYVLLGLVHDRMIRRLGIAPLPAALATLTLAAFPPFALWSTSGLATMPFALLVFVVFDRLLLRESPDPLGGGLAALALALIRSEGFAWCVVLFVLAAAFRRGGRRALLPAAAILAAGYAAYTGWRLSYYGNLLPNTAHAKLGPYLVEGWLRGARYVTSHFLVFLAPFALLPATWIALRHERARYGIPVAAMAWAFPAYAVAVSGDFLAMGRFLVPSFAFGTILTGWLLQRAAGTGLRRAAPVALAGAMVVLGLLPGWNVHLVPESLREKSGFRHAWPGFLSEYEYWRALEEYTEFWSLKGRLLRRYVEEHPFAGPDPACVVGPLGCIGYTSGLTLLDRAGLVTPAVTSSTHFRHPGKSTPGHDRVVPYGFFTDLHPEILYSDVLDTADPDSVTGACQRLLRMSAQPGLSGIRDSYRVDFAVLDDQSSPDRPFVLLAWRKIEGDPGRAWQLYHARVDSLRTAPREAEPEPTDRKARPQTWSHRAAAERAREGDFR